MDADRFDGLLAALASAPSRRAALRLIGGFGLSALLGQTGQADAKKKKRKKCAKAGQATGKGKKRKKRKKCCAGLVPDANGICVNPASPPPPPPPPPCVPEACAANACGDIPDGCGGTLACGGCAGERICVDGVCQDCTVICTASPTECGTILGTAMSAGGTVYVCPGLYQETYGIGVTGVTVIGAGAGNDPARDTILDAAGAGRVLEVGTGPVELKRLRLTGGKAIIAGGGILLREGATLRMTECAVSGNRVDASGGSFRGGGGISASGTLEMTRCTVRDNHAAGDSGNGGGILAIGTVTLTDCLVEGNSAEHFGGGLLVADETTTLAGNTRVRDNSAESGGGIFVDTEMGVSGTLVIAETCRVTENTAAASASGGGIFNDGGLVTLQGTDPSPIVVDNCFENCAPADSVAKCSTAPPVSPCP